MLDFRPFGDRFKILNRFINIHRKKNLLSFKPYKQMESIHTSKYGLNQLNPDILFSLNQICVNLNPI
jgi:hypothetical protein